MIKKKALRARMTKGSYLEVAKFKAAYFKNDNDCKRCDEEAALLAKQKQKIIEDLKAAKKDMAKAKFRLIKSKSKGNNEVAHQGRLLFVDTLAFGF